MNETAVGLFLGGGGGNPNNQPTMLSTDLIVLD
jgi:hypothetical protein